MQKKKVPAEVHIFCQLLKQAPAEHGVSSFHVCESLEDTGIPPEHLADYILK